MREQEPIVVCKLGRVEYEPTWALQKQLQDKLVAAKRSIPKEKLSHVMLLLEHPPVYTLGKSGDRNNLLANAEDLSDANATFVHVDRGGDITYHGPGQLVLYPILDLDYFYTDIHRYLRELEDVVIRTCEEYGVVADRVAGRTGVWIPPSAPSELARKICAMGIRCSRWVTMHGIGFNLNTEMERYEQIIPCGISDGDVTSLARETGGVVDEAAVQNALLSHFENVFGAKITIYEGSDAQDFLAMYLA